MPRTNLCIQVAFALSLHMHFSTSLKLLNQDRITWDEYEIDKYTMDLSESLTFQSAPNPGECGNSPTLYISAENALAKKIAAMKKKEVLKDGKRQTCGGGSNRKEVTISSGEKKSIKGDLTDQYKRAAIANDLCIGKYKSTCKWIVVGKEAAALLSRCGAQKEEPEDRHLFSPDPALANLKTGKDEMGSAAKKIIDDHEGECKKTASCKGKLTAAACAKAASEESSSIIAFKLGVPRNGESFTCEFYTSECTEGTAAPYFWTYNGKSTIMWAKNDPKVKNINGEEFEIMATGTFSLVSLKKKDTQQTALEVLSTVDRAGTRCGATYISNVTLKGEWVQELDVPQIEIRAEPAVPKRQALQINLYGSWKPANSHEISASVHEATAKKFVLKLHRVTVSVTIDSHRIHEQGVKTKRYANFLNVNIGGISTLSGLSIGGLLGRDSHKDAAAIPEGCESTNLLGSVQDKMFSQAEVS